MAAKRFYSDVTLGRAFTMAKLQEGSGAVDSADFNDVLKAAEDSAFSLEKLGAALQRSCRCESVRDYLASYEHREVKATLAANILSNHQHHNNNNNTRHDSAHGRSGSGNSATLAKVPVLHCVAAKNCTRCLDLLLRYYGADANSTAIIDRHRTLVPVLAFAVAYTWDADADTTAVVQLLLAYGADPLVIPG